MSISVITPVYNTGSLLRDLLSCLTAQEEDNFEWIVVNDGSTDQETLVILEEIASSVIKTNIISTENNGAAKARNIGISRSTGEYIKFIDADDFVPPNHLRVQYNDALKNNENAITVSPTKIVYEYEGKEKKELFLDLHQDYFSNVLLNSLEMFKFNHSGCLIPAKLIKDKVRWDVSLHAYQDLDFLWRLMLTGSEFVVNNDTFFVNREHDITKRITTQKSPEKWESRFKAVKKIYLHLEKNSFDSKYFANVNKRLDKIIVGAYQEFPKTGLKLLDAKKRLTGEGLSLYLILRFIKSKIKSFIS